MQKSHFISAASAICGLLVMVHGLVLSATAIQADDKLDSTQKLFRAGAVTVDVTPTKLPAIIAGGFLEGQATKITDRLFVRAIVLDDGSTTIALTVVDTCMMTQQLIDEAKELASKQCGIPVDKMMVSATHTHSAPAAMGCLGTRQDKEYAQQLPGKIAEAIVAAHAKLAPARVGWASTDDWEHTHNRRWIRQPEKKIVDPFGNATGLAHMHPGYQSSDVIGPSGPVDPGLSVLSLQSLQGQPIAVLANYSQHYFGSPAVSADYYGAFCRHVATLLGQPGDGNGPFVCAMSQGTSGDLMWMDYGSPAKSLTMDRYAEAVARYAEQALDRVEYRDFAPLEMVEKKLSLKYRVPDQDRLAWAKPIAAGIENDVPKNQREVYAREAIILHERQQTEIKLQAIRIGDLTIATLPNEVYALTGLKLKGRSPSRLHFNVELANGAEGYIPPPEQHVLGGYTTWPARTAGLEVKAETKIVDTLVEGLEQVTGQKRRMMSDEHGPYARAILAAKPIAYWRLNDEDGASARNAVEGSKRAELRGGFAWYLPGVGSGSGIGDQEELTPSAFSGPGQVNRAVHLAGGKLSAELEQLGDQYSVSFWFWLGERSGASERSGTLFIGPRGEQVVAQQDRDHVVQLLINDKLVPAKWQADQWHSLTLVRDGEVMHTYVDGATEPVEKTKLAGQAHSHKLVFGENLQGKVDELAVFDRVLTPSDVAQFWLASGIAEQHAREEADRKRAAEEAAARAKPPQFPAGYTESIEALRPIVTTSLASLPDHLRSVGAVTTAEKTYASFAGGRIAGSSDRLRDGYSVSLWFRNELPNTARPVTAYLFSRGPDGDAQAPGDHVGIGGTYQANLTGKLMFFNGNARNQVVAGPTTIPPGTWNHMVVIRSNGRIRAFLNGETKPEIDAEIDSVLPAGSAGQSQFFIGARSDHFAPLQGHLAHFALFDRALSDAEAKQLHAASGQRVGTPEATAFLAPRPASEPLSPERSLSKIHVAKGFRAELVAAEPQVLDPVAFDWDWSGRLWVVEMADYPLGIDGQGKPGGRVRVLEDRDQDGRYETSQLFADGLNFPNGIMTWRDGVLVTAAPNIWFLRDTDGDGVADKREVLLKGFHEGNQQLRLNGLRWGLDNWVYCANGGHHANYGVGTKVTSLRNGKTYDIGSRDFRFHPDTGEVELESGPSQFGRNRDPWGHWFGTQNAHPLWHYVIPDRYLARNPFVPTPKPIQHVVPPGITEVHPASPPEKRFHSFQEAGHFTSACSGMIYGDARLFGTGPNMHAFTCEPFHNLVQHNIVQEDGVSFRSHRPVSEGRFDFFASEDRWCRPVMARTGPDGALWVADMYRYMIEHPEWLPPEGKAELLPHYRLGDDRGRIYRIVPSNQPRGDAWSAFNNDTPALVAALDSSSDWRRDKAQQMLVARRDASASPLIAQLFQRSQRPETRVQSLWTLDGLDALTAPLLIAALNDPHPRVRENAIRLAEERQEAAIIAAAVGLAHDSDPQVCLQLALSCGQWSDSGAGSVLVELARRFHGDPLMKSAIMSSALAHAKVFAEGILQSDSEVQAAFREPLVRQSVGRKDVDMLALLFSRALASPPNQRVGRLDDFLLTLQRVGTGFEELAAWDQRQQLAPLLVQLDKAFAVMAEVARDDTNLPAERLAAASLLCRSPEYRSQGIELLGDWLDPKVDPEIQHRALDALSSTSSDAVPLALAEVWSELSPDLRSHALEVWISRASWTGNLLERIERGEVSARSFDLSLRARMLQYPDAAIAARASKLFSETEKSPRKQIVEEYRAALELAGDRERGKQVYTRACASCHRRGSDGHEVGPNLATVVNHSTEKLLTNILNPNADIQPGYHAYVCLLDSGEVISGLLAGETANSVTLKQANGQSRTVSRLEIDKLRNLNVSFMPEGLETTLAPQDMADLLQFLQQPIAN